MPWSPISEARESPFAAKQIRLQCPHCQGFAYAAIPWDVTTETPAGIEKRQQLIKAAIDEHRVVCTGADATEGRVYTIEYPRA